MMEQQMEVVEGYRKILVTSEQDSFSEIDQMKQQIDSFEEDRGK